MISWAGAVFRAHTPQYAHDPYSTEGCLYAVGRFNRLGDRVLYLSMDQGTALAEVSNGFGHLTSPKLVASYQADLEGLADLRSKKSRTALNVREIEISLDDWRDVIDAGGEPSSWSVVERMKALGANGLICPSYAPDVRPGATNIILWNFGPESLCRLSVYDPDQALPKNRKSWED